MGSCRPAQPEGGGRSPVRRRVISATLLDALMKPAEVSEMFEYLIETRSRFLDSFRKIGWGEFTKDRGATWGSLLSIFLHSLDDEEGWWQIALKGGSLSEAPDRKPGDYGDFDQVAKDNARVAALTRFRIAELNEQELGRSVTFEAGTKLTRTFERILFHAFTDEVAHVGEFVCLLWQMKLEPPFVDWLDFRQS